MINEGYNGIGIDLQKRSIWEKYNLPENILREEIIQPNKISFPDYNWLIGNHSDELTPWIPLIAARSSPETK